MKSDNGLMLCDFCGNSEHVAKLIVRGNDDAAICDECIDLCGEIVADRRAEGKKPEHALISLAKAWAAKARRKL